ncbi:MAG TPA: phosphoenolpyruvate synthase [Syntrophales bacterium]|jgi:pyruvate,water dikinase|nr:phosphoenolpyruvate synthase [Syntrophales bacterium]HPC31558.1 phosphoenolpyruvate synthase [Syntrophales bacterium]HQG34799.1 phosphoenolpyruvate synthase [Syntrophales bacterium]HQI34861.1 phosphoenolpyruvate synthase [Syntrophales bacterium]HRR46237.1 phosphoenolpyruvate synthase [Syntrophales bacterium]
MNDNRLVIWFDELQLGDIPQVGGKNASLGEMRRELIPKGVNIPDGYAVTAHAYRYLLQSAGIFNEIKAVLSDLDTHNIENLKARGHKVRELIYNAPFPADLTAAIIEAYRKLCEEYGENTDVAVRSSATAEDLPDASFAGQQETYLNITGEAALIEACKRCFASLFTDRAISYRVDKGFDHMSIALSIGVQKMVRSDLAASGVIFSIDTESGFKEAVLITGAYGLGETVVQGTVNPDEFYVFKPTLKQGYRPIVQKKLGTKEIKMVYAAHQGGEATETVSVPVEQRRKFCLNDDEILKLARWTTIIEDHYSQQAGYFKPMDIEWGKDGRTGELFILQARPETVQSQKDASVLESYVLQEQKIPLVTGTAVGSKIGAGPANIIESVDQIMNFKKGEVLVTDMTDPDWEPVMKIAAAIVTNKGGRTCHAAIVSRELGVPCIVGTENGTTALKGVKEATVSCAEGEIGNVYEGILKFDVQRVDAKNLERPKTQIMMNVGNPENAFNLAAIPNDGVGLARLEFIINQFISIHPMALIQFEKVTDPAIREKIAALTHGYDNRADFFVDKLAQGVAKIAAAFYPHDVIVRMSDFKSNEYKNLIGGQYFEMDEENPMIGFRGASRYYDERYRDAFALECEAMKKVRNEMGLVNAKLMIPFCRTVEEGKKVVDLMAEKGLVRGENNLEIYMMVEIPSNVILIEEFGKIFDGFSIGSNDLTQLTLGLDRDSFLISHIFDERNQAVMDLIRIAITKANKMGKKIGICGQAPSDYPEFARFLVECGISSISLNSDTVIKTTIDIKETEKALGK